MSIDFKPISLENISLINSFTSIDDNYSCEFAPANLIMWNKAYNYEFAEFNGGIIIRLKFKGRFLYQFPFGDIEKGINLILRISETDGHIPMIVLQKNKLSEKFMSIYSEKFDFTPYRENYEYIYSSEKLATLSGKKMHQKRNHISSFSKKHDWHFELLNDNNVDDALNISKKWFEQKGISNNDLPYFECSELKELYKNKDKLSLIGGVLYVDDIPVAYTLGSPVNDYVFATHSEKVLDGFQTAYSVINREFAKVLCEKFKYINREDDLGIEGLRRAKMSYYPEILLEKYICTPK